MKGQHVNQSGNLGANERFKKISSLNTIFSTSDSVGSDGGDTLAAHSISMTLESLLAEFGEKTSQPPSW